MSQPLPVICERCRAEGMAGDEAFAGIPDILDFEPVPRRARADGWRPEHQRAFIAALAVTGSQRRAARAIGRHAFGAEQLRKARGGRGFAAAWDAALDLYRDREMARLKDNLAGLADEQERLAASPFAAFDDDEEGAAERRDHEEAQARIRERLLRARRLYLASIRPDPARRAAWELLCGPVDWARAERIEPQEDEPPGVPNMRGPDMLLTAAAGLLPDLTGGPGASERLLRAVMAHHAAAGQAPPPPGEAGPGPGAAAPAQDAPETER